MRNFKALGCVEQELKTGRGLNQPAPSLSRASNTLGLIGLTNFLNIKYHGKSPFEIVMKVFVICSLPTFIRMMSFKRKAKHWAFRYSFKD